MQQVLLLILLHIENMNHDKNKEESHQLPLNAAAHHRSYGFNHFFLSKFIEEPFLHSKLYACKCTVRWVLTVANAH